jgi:hypothetical protein
MNAERAASAQLAAMQGLNHDRRVRGDGIAGGMRGAVRGKAMSSVRG